MFELDREDTLLTCYAPADAELLDSSNLFLESTETFYKFSPDDSTYHSPSFMVNFYNRSVQDKTDVRRDPDCHDGKIEVKSEKVSEKNSYSKELKIEKVSDNFPSFPSCKVSFNSAHPWFSQTNADITNGANFSAYVRYTQNNFSSTSVSDGSPSASGSWSGSDDNDEFSGCDEPADETEAQIIDSLRNVRLPTTKSPIMDALVYCAVRGWGISVARSIRKSETEAPSVVFIVTDFPKYYRISSVICSKHNPTEQIGSRIKALKRWFVRFPKKRERNQSEYFYLEVKPSCADKINDILDHHLGIGRRVELIHL